MKKILPEIPLLETENYQLRGLSLEDALGLFDFMRDVDTMKYITPHPVQTLVDMEEKIKGQLINFHNGKEIPWVIIQKSTQEIIGMFRLHKIHMWHKKAEMGVVIKKEHQQKGVD
jgi:ribosomal-protein-alanine N-acetyltransferase